MSVITGEDQGQANADQITQASQEGDDMAGAEINGGGANPDGHATNQVAVGGQAGVRL